MSDTLMLTYTQAHTILMTAHHALEQLEALDPHTLSETEQEAREHFLEQWYTLAAAIRMQYPGVFPLLLTSHENSPNPCDRDRHDRRTAHHG